VVAGRAAFRPCAALLPALSARSRSMADANTFSSFLRVTHSPSHGTNLGFLALAGQKEFNVSETNCFVVGRRRILFIVNFISPVVGDANGYTLAEALFMGGHGEG